MSAILRLRTSLALGVLAGSLPGLHLFAWGDDQRNSFGSPNRNQQGPAGVQSRASLKTILEESVVVDHRRPSEDFCRGSR